MRQPKAIICVGAPCSGKSTFAFKQEIKRWAVVERDRIRAELQQDLKEVDYTTWDWSREGQVTDIFNEYLNKHISAKKNIVISDTNLHEGRRKELVNKLEKAGYDVEIKLFPVDEFEALKRDSKRGTRAVGAKVIFDFCERFNKQFPMDRVVQDRQNPGAFIFDIDGTLAQMNNRSPYDWDKVGNDIPRRSVVLMIDALRYDYKIVIMSGRDSSCYDLTKDWLDQHGVHYDDLFMRASGDMRDDRVVKKEMFDEWVLPNYYVVGVFDDRPKMVRAWRKMGLETFAIGNQLVDF